MLYNPSTTFFSSQDFNFFQSPSQPVPDEPTLTDCSTPSPTCIIVTFPEVIVNASSYNRVRLPIGPNAHGAGYETRVTPLAADATVDLSTLPTSIENKLAVRNFDTNDWFGAFLSPDNIGQSLFCGENCEVRHWTFDGGMIAGDTFSAIVEIIPVLNPCDGCTISCDGDFSTYANGCTANPGGTNCVTMNYDPVTGDLLGSCAVANGANKIRVNLISQD